MFPSAIIAANQLDNSVSLDGITEVEKSKYLERLNSIPEELREIFNKYYATPYFNNKKVQNIEGKH